MGDIAHLGDAVHYHESLYPVLLFVRGLTPKGDIQ